MKTVLYCRVSTLDQTLEHQRVQAEQAGFKPDLVLVDHGISGVATRLRERPEGKRLFDVLREGDTLVVRWIDRDNSTAALMRARLRELFTVANAESPAAIFFTSSWKNLFASPWTNSAVTGSRTATFLWNHSPLEYTSRCLNAVANASAAAASVAISRVNR
jgi:Resolvase, N terminal domain